MVNTFGLWLFEGSMYMTLSQPQTTQLVWYKNITNIIAACNNMRQQQHAVFAPSFILGVGRVISAH